MAIFVPEERLAADKTTQTLHRLTSYSVLLKMLQSGRIKNFISTSASQRRRTLKLWTTVPLDLTHLYNSLRLSTTHASPTLPFSGKISSSLTLGNPFPSFPPRQTTSRRPRPSTCLRKLISKEGLDNQPMFGHWPARSFKSVQDSPYSNLPGRDRWHPQENRGDTREDAGSVVGRVQESSRMVR